MEYQAKELFAKHGVATTSGKVVTTAEDARAAAEEIGGVTVVKAQVKAGGRGKAGGVKIAKTPDEAEEHARADPRHADQGPHGQPGARRPGDPAGGGVLLLLPARPRQPVATSASPASRAVWRSRRSPRPTPTRSSRSRSTPARASTRPRPRRSSTRPASRPSCATRPSTWCKALWKVFVEEDATLVEVNPLARLEGDKLEALDGKVSLDDNADFRHEDHAGFEIREETDPLEAKAKDKGLNYVKLDGAGRHHRQRRGPGHEHPRRRRLRR